MWRYHANRMDARRSQFDLGRADAYIKTVHLAEGSNVVVLELSHSTQFGRESRKFASGVRKYGKFDDGRWQTRRAASISSR